MIIGREPSCDIWLADAAVSRRHAQMQPAEDGRWIIDDLGSQNGTWVNDQRREHFVLDDDDRIRIGDCTLLMELARAPEEPLMQLALPETMPAQNRGLWAFVAGYVELVRTLNRAPREEDICSQLAQGVLRLCKARRTAVALFEDGAIHWRASRAAIGEAPSPPELSEMLRKRLCAESLTVERLSAESQRASQGIDTDFLFFPLRTTGETCGVLFVERDTGEGGLRQEEAWIIRLAALEAANRLARLQADIQAAQQRQVMANLDAARRIQLGLLPSNLEIDPRVNVGALNLPSVVVSGDTYDVRRLNDNNLFFAIADASGCGLPAALMAMHFHAGLRMAMRQTSDLKEIHSMLDRHLSESGFQGGFITGILGNLDLTTGEFRLTNAGHPLPLLRSDGRVMAMSSHLSTTPWGWGWPDEIPVATGHLRSPTDAILLFTDGLIEAPSPSDEIFGWDRLLHLASDIPWTNMQETAEAIAQRATSWSSRALADDLTLLAVCRKTAPG